jgi:serine phosphatase RsbU (regulator of sigma subunit)
MHQLVQLTLGQHVDEGESDDGLELGACYLDADLATTTSCGARFEIFKVADGVVEVTKGTKRGIGYRGISFAQEYEEFTLPVVSGATYFLATDGLIDQVGGDKCRSFGKIRFGELLLSIKDLPMAQQKGRILEAVTECQGEKLRRDDVTVTGFRIC